MRVMEIMKSGAILAAGAYIASNLTPGHTTNGWQTGQNRPVLAGEAAAHGPLHGLLSRITG